MSSMTLYYVDGGYTEFPDGGAQAPDVLEWWRDSTDNSVITLNAQNGMVVHALRRAITRIVVSA